MLIPALLAIAALAAATPPPGMAPPPGSGDLPPGAPSDDYGIVAWCYGALSGHMELHDIVKPDLDAVSPDGGDDAELTAAGQDYLKLYQRAMEKAEGSSADPINVRGGEEIAKGHSIFDKARVADNKTRMWSYVLWELPNRCEQSADAILGIAAK